jgi:DNA polymerase III delta subunit
VKANMTHYRKLFSDVDKHGARSLYLLHGSEGLIMERMAQKIVASIVPDDLRAFNLTVAYGSEFDVDTFIATASSFPFLAERRVLVLRELEKLRGKWAPLIEYCRSPVPSSVVIFLYNPYDEWKNKVRAPKDIEQLKAVVERAGAVMAFESLASEDLFAWVRQEGKRLGVELDPEAAEVLVRSVGENLYDLQNELVKLSLLFDGRSAGVHDLAGVIGGYRLNALPELIESLVPGREGAALTVLRRIVESGAERPSSIIYQLTRHFLGLLKAKAGIGGGGYRYEQAQRRASRFSERAIVVWLENLRRGELALKTSSFPEEALLVGIVAHSFHGALMDYPLAA